MPVLLDTGPLIAYLDEDDRAHPVVKPVMRDVLAGAHGTILSTDYVLDEGLTLIGRKNKPRELAERFASLFWGPWPWGGRPLELVATELADLRAACDLLLRHYDQRLSTTDCTLILHARARNASVLTLDGGLRGLVDVVPLEGSG